MRPKRSMLQGLQAEVAELREAIMNTPRLHVKDVQRRYGISEVTVYRWLRDGVLPPPIRFNGSLWRPEDLVAAEKAGQLSPAPKEGTRPEAALG